LRLDLDRARGARGEVSRIGCGVVKSLVGALLLIVSSSPVCAGDDASESDRIDFVAGNLVFVLLHEFSHLVIEDFEVPVLGNNEDAADTLAAVWLIRADRERLEGDFELIRVLLAAADANRILWQTGLEQENPVIYVASHPLSVQRAARITCLAYGSDPELLEPLPEIVGLPDFRADWCEEEYEAAEKAWFWVRDSYILKNPGNASGHEVEYGPTDDPDQETLRDLLVASRLLERVLEVVQDSMLLRDDIILMTRSCGEPNAYWDGNTRELVVCYELVDAFFNLSEDEGMRELVEQIREFHRDN